MGTIQALRSVSGFTVVPLNTIESVARTRVTSAHARIWILTAKTNRACTETCVSLRSSLPHAGASIPRWRLSVSTCLPACLPACLHDSGPSICLWTLNCAFLPLLYALPVCVCVCVCLSVCRNESEGNAVDNLMRWAECQQAQAKTDTRRVVSEPSQHGEDRRQTTEQESARSNK